MMLKQKGRSFSDGEKQGCLTISGTGVYLPQRVVTAAELDGKTGRPDGWTARHTGVLERHWVDQETQSEMGAWAARAALQDAGLGLQDVDTLICASGTPEQPIPSTAARVLAALDPSSSHLAAYDMNATCLSFLVAFDHAALLIETGRAHCVLLVSTEIASAGLDFRDSESAALMGDGAAAVLLQRAEGGSRVLDFQMRTFPEGVGFAEIRGGGTLLHPSRHPFCAADHLFRMRGKDLFKLVSQHLSQQVRGLMESQGVGWRDIKAIVPHQASGPAVNLLCKKLKIPDEKMVRTFAKYGNTIAASLPMALHDLRERMPLEKGDKVLFVGTSAGVSIASLLLEI